MNTLRRLLLLGLVAMATVSCAHVPRSPGGAESTEGLRTQYLRDNPDSPYAAQIEKGELAEGMNVLEVLASWGFPKRRTISRSEETWMYVEQDEFNSDFVRYTLLFDDSRLERWIMDRSTSASGSVISHGELNSGFRSTRSQLPVPTPFRGTSVPKK